MFSLIVLNVLLMTSAMSCPLWSSDLRVLDIGFVGFTSPMRTECGMFVRYLYAVLYVRVSCIANERDFEVS